jgi:hypothetical protein
MPRLRACSRAFERRRGEPAGSADLSPQARLHRAHLTIVFAALAVNRWIEDKTGWSIRKFVRTIRRYRTIEIQQARTTTAADPLPTTTLRPSKASHALADLRTNVAQLEAAGTARCGR